ncbi:hypothetical protein LOK49_LG07G03370 [Camellia lanceoleosa]|uniref:Uncharacterized protein n=1 Tax=Camellia lanceoleosa TaxID=1840588 RepID=A0ACC0H845_9ERIC|nr:hypothetical protein LOK49_LG07G03370 [Camellia lanceoleosa]
MVAWQVDAEGGDGVCVMSEGLCWGWCSSVDSRIVAVLAAALDCNGSVCAVAYYWFLRMDRREVSPRDDSAADMG